MKLIAGLMLLGALVGGLFAVLDHDVKVRKASNPEELLETIRREEGL